MPTPVDPSLGCGSPEFMSLLHQLHVLHDTELDYLRTEIHRLRQAAGLPNLGMESTVTGPHTFGLKIPQQGVEPCTNGNSSSCRVPPQAAMHPDVYCLEAQFGDECLVMRPRNGVDVGNGRSPRDKVQDAPIDFHFGVDASGSTPLAPPPEKSNGKLPVAAPGEEHGNQECVFTSVPSDGISVTRSSSISSTGPQLAHQMVLKLHAMSHSDRAQMDHLPFQYKPKSQEDIQVSWREFLELLVTNPMTESFFAFLIVLNACVMALEIQHDGFQIGQRIGYDRNGALSFDDWPWAPGFFKGSETFFGAIFAIELFLKIIVLRADFRKDWWNWMDVVIVLFWMLDQIGGTAMSIQPNMLRIMRLARLLRLLRLVRMIHSFDALYLMTTALKGCVSVLAWACALLSVVQMMISLLLNQYLYDSYFNKDTSQDPEEMQLMFEYFGTFTRTMLSMFEITLGNWPPVCRLLAENSHELFMLLCVIHKLIIGFAVVGVINGVFMQETFKVASIDDRIMVRQKERSMKVHQQKMRQLFMEADSSGDGQLSLDEFKAIVSIPAVKTWLGSMELDASDADDLFDLIDTEGNGDGQVSVDELVKGVSHLKGAARSIDLILFMKEFNVRMAELSESVQDTNMRVKKVGKSIAKHPTQRLIARAAGDRQGAQDSKASGSTSMDMSRGISPT